MLAYKCKIMGKKIKVKVNVELGSCKNIYILVTNGPKLAFHIQLGSSCWL
jgi:thiamine biosynthesis protein ThiC